MTSQQILQSDLLDILFDGRNKMYGAYLLRRTYPAQLLKALGITTLLVVALLFFGGPSTNSTAGGLVADGFEITTVVLPPDVKPELPRPKVQQAAAAQRQAVQQEKLIDNIVAVDNTVNPVATQDRLSHSIIGSTTVVGPPSSGVPPPAIGGTGIVEPVVEKKDPPLPSRQPQFPGGTNAWLAFLSRYLTPPADLEAGEKRSVLVRFSVDEEGAVTNFQVVQSGGTDFDNEVIRVLKKMPRWLPAIQQGKPVPVNFTQPVTFVAQE
ncbi:MAG TPA: energy transducer TonB [Flavisolibacter sp.]|jgi:protein TonB|nr:energy transducer TonB [Flavisolibacter sp.]